MDNNDVETAEEFCYLGSMLSKTAGADVDVNTKTNKAKGVFPQLPPIWQSNHLSKKLKLKTFNTNIKSVLLHGS
jgi:hypothetical protein